MGNMSLSPPSVTIVGGGYAGVGLAHALRTDFDVTLVEKDDSLTHVYGTPRAMVVPGFEKLLRLGIGKGVVGKRGRVVQAYATKVDEGMVELDTGEVLQSDYVVIATGGPSQRASMRNQRTRSRNDYYHQLHHSQQILKEAASVLVVGAGPTGLEVIGELKDAYPNKRVVLVESGNRVLQHVHNLYDNLRPKVRARLQELDVELRLGVRVEEAALTRGKEAVVATPGQQFRLSDGTVVQADAVCFATGQRNGPTAAQKFLQSNALTDRGLVRVDGHLQVEGLRGVFAIGDCTCLSEAKTGFMCRLHAEYLAQALLARAAGEQSISEYHPGRVSMLVLPMGKSWGVMSVNGEPRSDFVASMLKGKDYLRAKVAKDLGLSVLPAE